MATGLSIHIGLNHVDPTAYNGWDGSLSGCINDARDMQSIADGLGYQTSLFTDSQATSARVVSEIGQAAQALGSGDILFLTYSGHGGQVPDVNNEETDAQDETWVLWDRQLIDDELYALWSQFAPGVRIFMLSDSCHSGTVLRMMATYRELTRQLRSRKDAPSEAERSVLATLESALELNGAPAPEAPTGGGGAPTRDAKGRYIRPANTLSATTGSAVPGSATMRSAAAQSATGRSTTSVLERPPATSVHGDTVEMYYGDGAPTSGIKMVPPDVLDLVNETRAAEHATYQWIAGPSERAIVSASVILISGCQDNQTSLDGAGNGLFTEKLKAAWSNGAFSGDYQSLWADIVARMPASQRPNYATTGAPNPTFEAQRPFTIDAGVNGGSTPTTGRPTLRRGSRGPDVSYLQQKLVDAGYSLAIDGDFGFYTESAVVQFQQAHGLSADGVVGHETWAALGGGSPMPPPDDGHQPDDGQEPSTNGSTPAPTTTRPTLRQGMNGPDVQYLQNRLRAYGYNIAADGQFGAMTKSAVQSFQRANGLTVDGTVGPATWEALG